MAEGRQIIVELHHIDLRPETERLIKLIQAEIEEGIAQMVQIPMREQG